MLDTDTPTDSGVCLQAIFQDPDGNIVILHNRYAPQPAVSSDPG